MNEAIVPFSCRTVLGAALIVIAALPGCGVAASGSHAGSGGTAAAQTATARPSMLQPDEMAPPLDSVTADSGGGSSESPGKADKGLANDTGKGPAANPESTADAGAPSRAAEGRPTASRSRAYTEVGTVGDAQGDQGLEGPDYADVVAVTIGDNGTNVRIIVDMAEDIPRHLRQGELMGVGVDLWRDPSRHESDYQLYAEGGDDGWFAHLHTPDGLVDYPGEFRLGGRRLVFDVQWEHVGGMTAGGFRAFADWSQQRPAVNAASQDQAPKTQPASFRR